MNLWSTSTRRPPGSHHPRLLQCWFEFASGAEAVAGVKEVMTAPPKPSDGDKCSATNGRSCSERRAHNMSTRNSWSPSESKVCQRRTGACAKPYGRIGFEAAPLYCAPVFWQGVSSGAGGLVRRQYFATEHLQVHMHTQHHVQDDANSFQPVRPRSFIQI